jgi:hypothetical protein
MEKGRRPFPFCFFVCTGALDNCIGTSHQPFACLMPPKTEQYRAQTEPYLPHIGGIYGVNRRGIEHEKRPDNSAGMPRYLAFDRDAPSVALKALVTRAHASLQASWECRRVGGTQSGVSAGR